ncbi:hypothetical protein [Streptomyces sp. NPDC093111]|uniref:hypothetical protein n=1 Tax=Streptomyces sp. NPDC093111 TaxID=3154978 RepID=UPI00342462EA
MTPALRTARSRALGPVLACCLAACAVSVTGPPAYAYGAEVTPAGPAGPATTGHGTRAGAGENDGNDGADDAGGDDSGTGGSSAPVRTPAASTAPPRGTGTGTGTGTAPPTAATAATVVPRPTATGSGSGSGSPSSTASPVPAPSGSAAGSDGRPAPNGSASLAGHPAGEGREHPGRPPEPSSPAATSPSAPSESPSRTKTATEDAPDLEADEAVGAVPETELPHPSSSAEALPAAAPRIGAEAVATLSDRRIPVLTLGVGLALMGLGIGFLGVRMRRR